MDRIPVADRPVAEPGRACRVGVDADDDLRPVGVAVTPRGVEPVGGGAWTPISKPAECVAMNLCRWQSLGGMSNPTHTSTTITSIGVAMFTIAEQDAAIAFYTQTLGWELRADIPFGDEAGNRWVEVAPPGSTARLALNPPMGEWGPGGSAIGVETPDVEGEYARVQALDGVTTGDMMGGEGPVPRMFSIEDPDGNHIWVVQSQAST